MSIISLCERPSEIDIKYDHRLTEMIAHTSFPPDALSLDEDDDESAKRDSSLSLTGVAGVDDGPSCLSLGASVSDCRGSVLSFFDGGVAVAEIDDVGFTVVVDIVFGAVVVAEDE
jgi:hypothetical protein